MRIHKKTSVLVLASLVALGARQFALADDAPQTRGQFSAADYKFASEAARGGLMEVQAGELARSQGIDASVRQFGERMVKDHTKAGDELKAIADRKGAVLPATLDNKQQHMVDGLRKLSGKDFDKAYAVAMVKDHKTDLKEFQKAGQNADDADLRAFAARTSTVIAQHFEAAKQMRDTVKAEPGVAQR